MPNYEKAAERAARRYGLNPQIFKAMIRQESGFNPGFNPTARSGAGAQGIAQFMPATARQYGVNLGDGRAADDLDGAARYLRDNLRKYGDYHKALSVYNSGRPDAYKDPSFAQGQTYNYVRTILKGARGEKVGAPRGGSQAPSTPTVAGGSPFDPGEIQSLSAMIEAQKPQRPVSQGPQAPAFSARNALPLAGQQVQSSGGRAARPDIAGVLEQVRASGQSLPEVQASGVKQGSRSGGGSGKVGKGLGSAVSLVDGLVGQYGAPITAKQEPGHATGGDHDPAVKGATARDIGGDEATRKRIFTDLARRLGVKGAVYKGADINVVRGGVRYQIISRDHGTGPHLHIGMRRV